MKIAILLTGQMRDSHINYLNHYEQFIKPNNADVFVVTSTKNMWYSNNSTNKSKVDSKNLIYHLHSEKNKEEIEKNLKQYYNNFLKDFLILENENIPEKIIQPHYYSYFINNQFNNNKLAFNLALDFEKKNNIKYDLFVRLRIDKSVFPNIAILNKNMSLPIVTNIEPTTFFFVGNKEMMDYYCKFTYLKNYIYNENIQMPDPPKEILNFIKKKYNINIIKNILTIYFGKNGLISDNFPYLLNNKDDIGWNPSFKEPKKF
jgi:hypothetical protein